jgi:hypothetical protein
MQLLRWFYIDVNRASFGSEQTITLPKDGNIVCIMQAERPYRIALRILHEENAEMQERTFFVLETFPQYHTGSSIELKGFKHFATVQRGERSAFDIFEVIK